MPIICARDHENKRLEKRAKKQQKTKAEENKGGKKWWELNDFVGHLS